MSAEDQAVITFPIKFQLDPQNISDVKDEADKIKEAQETEVTEGEVKTPAGEGIDPEAVEALNDFLKTTDRQGLQTLSKFAKNPGGAVENELLGVLGKAGIQGALAATIIGLIISTPEIIMSLTKALAVKGGPLNQDFHRFFEDESQVGFQRELQYRRAVGLDVVITNDTRGFLLSDPGFVHNSLVDVEESRALRTSTKETKYGYTNGM